MNKICFYVPHAYSLFNPAVQHPFGGSEVQCWMLAKGLSRIHGNRVSYVVLDHKQPGVERHGEVRVYKHSYYKAFPRKIDVVREDVQGIPFKKSTFPYVDFKGKSIQTYLRSLYVRIFDFQYRIKQQLDPPIFIDGFEIESDKYRIFRRINADIYLASGVHVSAAELLAFCQKYGKFFVLLAASDYDFSEEHTRKGSWERDRYNAHLHLCHFVVNGADAIVTQTERQAKLLRQRFGRDSTTITNPVDLSETVVSRSYQQRDKALWVGKSDQVKRPEILIKLAAQFPDVDFLMVMNPSNRDVHKQVQQTKPDNVEIIEYVHYHQIEKLFSKAFVLINTSEFEGFPNTFLQAGKYGVPVLSMNVDPNGFIQQEACGIVTGGQFDLLVQGMKELLLNPELSDAFSENIMEYVRKYHKLEEKALQLNDLFGKL